MRAQVGDEIVVRGAHIGDPERHGVIVEVHGEDDGPPYLVRWSDGHQGVFFPSSDATITHPSPGGTDQSA
ncbi:MAG TPA: DUF1918 domain-containing protein [Acidimicrobiales bacterium]|nr:DUF1918 domain-containing protein [Acidimicrobiales bacterium]